MNAAAIAAALGGRKSGRDYLARCPAHDDRTPSLSICDARDGKVLVRCHAGCKQAAVIQELRNRGLWTMVGTAAKGCKQHSHAKLITLDDVQRQKYALKIWESASPGSGTLIEKYLRARGIGLPAPKALRFKSRLKHPSGCHLPAMIGLVTRGVDGKPMGIHRTFLAFDGSNKAAVEPQKMMLGPTCGGAVRLGEAGDELMVGEGVETCLAAMQASGLPAWAALSTSGLCKLPLPPHVVKIIVLADGDEAGEAAAQCCAKRWSREGRRVWIARPGAGLDFNDLLIGRRINLKEGEQ